MATIKVKLRPSRIPGKPGTVYYQVTHKRIVKQISTNIRIHIGQWDTEQQCFLTAIPDMVIIQNRIDSDRSVLHRIAHELEQRQMQTGEEYSAEDIVSRFHSSVSHISVTEYITKQIEVMKECNRLGTAINYGTVLESLTRFLSGRDLSFTELTASFIEQYDEYLQHKGLIKNSRSFHMRILRAVYNKAVSRGFTRQSHPFQNVYTGIDRTSKRAVNKSVISRLVEADLSYSAPLALTRDLFLFSLYTRGMSFIDIAFLKQENIRNGDILYVRSKTKQQLCIRIEPCIQKIINRYIDTNRSYIFPILKSEDLAVAYSQYRISMTYYNRLLKRLTKILGLQQSFSFYAARHSWATLARDNNVPVSIISAGMGHTSERTTQIYLKSLQNSLIDNVNRNILNKLK